MRLNYLILKLIAVIVLFFGLSNCNQNFESAKPVEFENMIEFSYAKGLKIYETNEGHVVTISNPNSGKILDHFIITKNSKSNISNIKTIQTPINRVLAYSSTYITFLDALDQVEKIKGVTYSQGISNEKINQQLETDSTIDVGSDQSPNKELIVSLKPDLALIYPSNGNHDWFSSFDIPTIINVEYLEIHPLAQAEWIKLYGILFNKQQTADSIFNSIESSYNANRINDSSKTKPVILCGELYDNVWTLPGGNSFINQLIKDAGGEYFLTNDTTSGSRKLDFEYILQHDSVIDYWMLLSYNPKEITYSLLKENQPRYSYLSVFKPNKISICNTAITPYFETSILDPHLLLNDIKSFIYRDEKAEYHYFSPLEKQVVY